MFKTTTDQILILISRKFYLEFTISLLQNYDLFTIGSPHCRAVLMCIKALDLDVDLIKLDMYQKYEHKKPWFVKVQVLSLALTFIKYHQLLDEPTTHSANPQ